jgi:hypothetical protein
MIQFICDECGAHIKDLPKEFRDNLSSKHYCRDCVVKWIREQAKKIADAPLEHAPYDQLLCIYQNLNGAYLNAMDIKSPWDPPICHVCGGEMTMHNPVKREYFCEKCMAIYDTYGNKLRDADITKKAIEVWNRRMKND